MFNLVQFLFGVIIVLSSVSTSYSQNDTDTINVWIDTDNGFGKINRDVDDAVAIISLLKTPHINIKGISLIRTVDYGYKSTKKIVDLYNTSEKEIPIYKGANSAKELGKETEASLGLIKALKNQKLTLILLGGTTNIATALRSNPNLASNIKEIVFCGGRQKDSLFKPGNGRFVFDDANFEFDYQSMKEILEYDIPFVFSGYEAATSFVINKNDLKPLLSKSDKNYTWLYRNFRSWNKIWKTFLGLNGFMPFDAVTTAYLVSPSHCNCEENIPVLINEVGKEEYSLDVSKSYISSKKVTYCKAINPDFKNILLRQILE